MLNILSINKNFSVSINSVDLNMAKEYDVTRVQGVVDVDGVVSSAQNGVVVTCVVAPCNFKVLQCSAMIFFFKH